MVGIVLAGGNGNRLKQSFDNECCKPLVKIKEKMLIEFSLEALIDLHIKDVYIVIGNDGERIKSAIGNSYKGLNISYVYQVKSDSLIDALVSALDKVNSDSAVTLLADEIFIGFKSQDIRNYIQDPDFDFYCGFTYENDPEKIKRNYSIETDEDFNIIRCTEKPSLVINNLKGTGFCIFSNDALSLLKLSYNAQSARELCDFINLLVDQNCKGLAVCVAEKEFNINTYEDLKEAHDYSET